MGRLWTDAEKKILTTNYPLISAIGCSSILSRSIKSIRKKARKLGLSTKTTLGGPKVRKHIVTRIGDKRCMAVCEKHGCTEHYLFQDRRPICLACRKLIDQKRSKSVHRKLLVNAAQRRRYSHPINNYANRLRRVLRFYSNGEISFSKHLGYSAEQLCSYLEDIRQEQNNCCPMYGVSYNETGFDIDHITPLFTATNMDEVLCLFALSNLSLLCPSCNRKTKRDNDMFLFNRAGGEI